MPERLPHGLVYGNGAARTSARRGDKHGRSSMPARMRAPTAGRRATKEKISLPQPLNLPLRGLTEPPRAGAIAGHQPERERADLPERLSTFAAAASAWQRHGLVTRL